MSESNLLETEVLAIELPWGVEELERIGAGDDIEALLIHQELISKQKKDIDELDLELEATKKLLTGKMLDIDTQSRKLDDQEALIQSLNERLEKYGEIDSEEIALLEKQLQEEQETHKQTKSFLAEAAIERDSLKEIRRLKELERDELERDVTRLKDDNQRKQSVLDEMQEEITGLKIGNKAYVKQAKSDLSRIEELERDLKIAQGEIAGFPVRLQNAEQTAVTRFKETARVDLSSALEKENAELKEEMEKLRAQALGVDSAAEEMEKLVADTLNKIEETNKAASDAWDTAVFYQQHNKKLMRKTAEIIDECEDLKQNNAYMYLMRSYFELRTIWEDEKTGEHAHVISMNPSLAFEAEGSDGVPDDDYPAVWVMRPDGSGHIVFVDKSSKELILPNSIPEGSLIAKEQQMGLRAAMLEMPVKEIAKAEEDARIRCSKVTEFSRLLDIEWTPMLKVADILEELERNGRTQEELDRIQGLIKRFNKHVPLMKQGIKKISNLIGTNVRTDKLAVKKRRSTNKKKKRR